ncbi:MAG TPA: response regulator [Syntrophorhabdaceae bacterium]|jgi:DNA-binding response OmpR family regulator
MSAKRKILVVDDDFMICTVVEFSLKKLGYDVVVATTGEDARKLFLNKRFTLDLAMVDEHLPDASGRKLCGELAGIRPDVLFALHTGDDLVFSGEMRLDGIHAVIPKGLSKTELGEELRHIFEHTSETERIIKMK